MEPIWFPNRDKMAFNSVNWFLNLDTSLLYLSILNNTQQTFFIGLQLSTFTGKLASEAAFVATIQFISHRIGSQKPDVVLSDGRTEHVHFIQGVQDQILQK